jgi:hypothetical protein
MERRRRSLRLRFRDAILDGCGEFKIRKSPDKSKMTTFATSLSSFCDELSLTFPELEKQMARAALITPAQFWSSWANGLPILLARDATALMGERKGFILGSVRLTATMWSEISKGTQDAIWKYLRTLILEAGMTIQDLPSEAMQTLFEIALAEKGGEEGAKPMMEKLKEMLAGGGIDLSGMDFTMPEIPERLRNGKIAKLAEDMAKQFDPTEFGIDPALLKGDNIEAIMKQLMEMYKRDPTAMMTGAKRMAEKIKKQILGGSLSRDDLIAEAQEYVELFKDHPMAKQFMGTSGLAEMFGGMSSSSTPSERRRTVQERLRKKLAERQAAAAKK